MISNSNKDYTWKLIAEKAECESSATKWPEQKGWFQDIEKCAEACYGVSSMFTFGTDDFGRKHSLGDRFACACQTTENENGTCQVISSVTRRLFKYEKGKRFWH